MISYAHISHYIMQLPDEPHEHQEHLGGHRICKHLNLNIQP